MKHSEKLLWPELANTPEYKEQMCVIDWIRLQHPWLINHTIYIINEQKTSKYVGDLLNKMGRLRGASDLFMAWPTKQFYGLFIEMKSKIGKPTTHQLSFLERMNKIGYYGCVCRGADEAIHVIDTYLKNKI